jgi:hypothetical protein
MAAEIAHFHEFLAEDQLYTGEGYLMQVAHGMSWPYAELLVAAAPDHMQQRYRAAVQRAAEIAASAGSADSVRRARQQ